MAVQRYHYKLGFRLFYAGFSLAWVIFILLFCYAVGAALLEEVITYQTDMTLICFFGLALSCPLISMPLLLLMVLSAYPAISVSENGFRLHTFIATSDWLSWEDIKKARPGSITKRKSWFIGAQRLGIFYLFTGLVFGLGMRGFMLTPSIENYDKLMNVLRKNRPDLFF